MGIYLLNTPDPENVADVARAYCVITEIHLGLTSKSVAVVLQCWRSFEAALEINNKKPFKTVSLTFSENGGGAEWLSGCQNYNSVDVMTVALEQFILRRAPAELKLEEVR